MGVGIVTPRLQKGFQSEFALLWEMMYWEIEWVNELFSFPSTNNLALILELVELLSIEDWVFIWEDRSYECHGFCIHQNELL